MLGIFIDFKGAFDHLEWSAIIKRLQYVGCQQLKIWPHYFSGRTAKAMSSTGSVDMELRRGVHKDWSLQQLEAKCKFSTYADDLLLFVEGKLRRQLETHANCCWLGT